MCYSTSLNTSVGHNRLLVASTSDRPHVHVRGCMIDLPYWDTGRMGAIHFTVVDAHELVTRTISYDGRAEEKENNKAPFFMLLQTWKGGTLVNGGTSLPELCYSHYSSLMLHPKMTKDDI